VNGEPDGCTCGARVPSGRRDGFCSSWCAARDAQGLEPQSPPPLRPPTVLAAVAGDVVPAGAVRHPRPMVEDRVRETLTQAGLLESWEAAAALDLAAAIDGDAGAGSARAALHRELRSVMGDLMRGRDAAGSRVGVMRNELGERRQRRSGGGAS
jgi:hypothetical protein